MKLGAFSISLNVKDLTASKEFYQKLGFEKLGGDEAQKWLILKNGDTVIGLFQGMLQGNVLTFNPGWDQSAQALETFDDVRAIQKHLLANDVTIDTQADGSTSGPAHIILKDPDGNVIMFDQHR